MTLIPQISAKAQHGREVDVGFGGGATFFLSSYTLLFTAVCCRFQLLLLLPRASRGHRGQTYVFQRDDQAFVYQTFNMAAKWVSK